MVVFIPVCEMINITESSASLKEENVQHVYRAYREVYGCVHT